MAKRTSLREFQEYLAGRLSRAAHGQKAASLLALQAGEEDWLLDLADTGEILPPPPLVTVPLTRPCFAGLANIRGNLYAVTDFAAFRGGEATLAAGSARLLLVGTRHGSNAALLVSRLLGLRNVADFTPEPPEPEAPAWGAERFRDNAGRIWNKLSVRALLADDNFMNVEA